MAGSKNIVRILQKYHNPRTDKDRELATTGLVIADGLVLTVTSFEQSDPKGLSDLFSNTIVSFVRCGESGDPLAVSSAALALVPGKSPYMLLTVPNLKKRDDGSDPDFSGFDPGTDIVVAGLLRDPKLIFGTAETVRKIDAAHTDNTIYFLSGNPVASFHTDFSEDDQERFYLDVPYSPGLIGSPIYGDSRLLGFVERSYRVGKNLAIAIAVSIEPLKGLAALKSKASGKGG
jgi:hypothetical protein